MGEIPWKFESSRPHHFQGPAFRCAGPTHVKVKVRHQIAYIALEIYVAEIWEWYSQKAPEQFLLEEYPKDLLFLQVKSNFKFYSV